MGAGGWGSRGLPLHKVEECQQQRGDEGWIGGGKGQGG